MHTSLKLLLSRIFIIITFLLAGCTGTSYYGVYYDPYPYHYQGHRSVHYHHHYRPRPPVNRPPNIGRPTQLPSRSPSPAQRR